MQNHSWRRSSKTLKEYLDILISIRKRNTQKDIVLLTSLLIIVSVVALAEDMFLGWNTLFMSIRAVTALVLALLVFSAWLLLRDKYAQKEFIRQLKENYTVKQRINLSLITIGLGIIIHLLVVGRGSYTYTIVTSLMLAFWMWLPLWISPTSYETQKSNLGLDDERDLIHERVSSKTAVKQAEADSVEDDEKERDSIDK